MPSAASKSVQERFLQPLFQCFRSCFCGSQCAFASLPLSLCVFVYVCGGFLGCLFLFSRKAPTLRDLHLTLAAPCALGRPVHPTAGLTAADFRLTDPASGATDPVPLISRSGLPFPFHWAVVTTAPPDCPCFTAPRPVRTGEGAGLTSCLYGQCLASAVRRTSSRRVCGGVGAGAF